MDFNSKEMQQENQEVDLKQVYSRVKSLIEGFKGFIFYQVRFFIKNSIVIIILIATGVGLGYFTDYMRKKYVTEITVTPNFGSTDYLYSKIEMLESKIEEEDTIFLKNLGFASPENICKININPIVDVYQFAYEKKENLSLLELMGEDGDLNKIISDRITSKNYPFHIISIITKRKVDEKAVIPPLTRFLNSSDYYEQIKKQSIINLENKIYQQEKSVTLINGILRNLADSIGKSIKDNKLVYLSEGNGLGEIVMVKDSILSTLNKERLARITKDKIVKESNIVMNVLQHRSFTQKMKYMFPLFFVLIFILLKRFISFYKEENLKRQY